MTTQIKHLVFKGIEKKEQILFKSFLNLAKNELAYQVVILKDGDDTAPDIAIVDAVYEPSGDDQGLSELPKIKVGNNVAESGVGYLSRPVQWSDFKTELTRLEFDAVAEVEDGEENRVLPDEMQFVIAEMDEKSESDVTEVNDASFSEAADYDYELDNMSIDYHSFTNSEYMKVVDDVQGFKDGQDIVEPEIPKQVVLVTDDESASTNSVLVIETNTLDAWEMSESELEDNTVTNLIVSEAEEPDTADDGDEKAISERLMAGTPVNEGDEFWKYDLEIFSGRESLLFIKPSRDMVYSTKEPAKWSKALVDNEITKIPLKGDWHPTDGLNAYPIDRLLWASTLATKNKALAEGLDEATEYILERWPQFELLELDNVLLKLCTLLFVSGESAYSLMQKSGYSRHVVFGLINACHQRGILRRADEVQLEDFSDASNEEGVFGKIKDVFR
ncbi:hypothetical protein [Arenicella xantha]|uniref:Uncharacterized protein n=1 Tax=Arenicella xantha TaxID=644221 RepID=A0A395JL86_9GAMM|nr:hypothetical protein [Arenicella xantha]RBP51471.1 hypothetical protein DFR28_102901 [Arenicella xantha]